MKNNNYACFSRALTAAIKCAVGVSSLLAINTSVLADSVPVNGGIHLSAALYTIAESAGKVNLTVERSGGTAGDLSVTYWTVNETALSGKNYAAESGTLTWRNGDGTNKTITVPVLPTKSTGTKYFYIRLKAVGATLLGAHTSATIDIVSSADESAPVVMKSIKEWGVSCSETNDETGLLKDAILASANNAFILMIDCPVRIHTWPNAGEVIAIPDGVTLAFQGPGEILTAGIGLTVADPTKVTFIDWNATVL